MEGRPQAGMILKMIIILISFALPHVTQLAYVRKRRECDVTKNIAKECR
ncbi:hypothetical protein BIFGAL_03657 [Bifidobacterium gallicum DSM 20093 = LMG 11596]|uniref:Uncharacterized protein n=1 Tax=Bifidobacterium gallicum DSM 20093 = LMG 11596 TaxID=561180 RepID=D1NUX9_9BIFI|nr:hypothetical protein BIFGAL_03657 [Bifidobacterium gallicum DSM 20093 = LMG 11596]